MSRNEVFAAGVLLLLGIIITAPIMFNEPKPVVVEPEQGQIQYIEIEDGVRMYLVPREYEPVYVHTEGD